MIKYRNIRGSKTFRFIGVILALTISIFGGYVLTAHTAEAFDFSFLVPTNLTGQELSLTLAAEKNKVSFFGQLPENDLVTPKKIFKMIPITAYSSEVGQTDSTPFITASGSTVRRGVVAANFLPIGTRVRFPDLYGEEFFIVEDRMNARYDKRIDIWMEETVDAKNFGIRWTTVEVF